MPSFRDSEAATLLGCQYPWGQEAAVGRLEPRGGGVGAALAWIVAAAAAEAVLGPPAEPLRHRNGDPGQFCVCLGLGLCDSSMCEHQYTSFCPCVRSLMPISCLFSIPRGILLSLRSSIPLSLYRNQGVCATGQV